MTPPFDARSSSFDALRSPETLAALVLHEEGELVERKVAEPAAGFGPIVSAFANSQGGWLVLGVSDRVGADGAMVEGFEPHGRAHLRDWLVDKLANELGVVPSFRAETFTFDGRPIGVVRVPASPQAPHYTADGRVYFRENGRTVVVTRRDQLEAIRRRANATAEDAERRLSTPQAAPVVDAALGRPFGEGALRADAMHLLLRVAPVLAPPNLRDFVLSRSAAERSAAFAVEAAYRLYRGDLMERLHCCPELRRSGHVASVRIRERWFDGIDVAMDAGGVFGFRVEGTNHDAYFLLIDDDLRRHLVPGLRHLADQLEAADALGPAVVSFAVGGVGRMEVFVHGPGAGALSGNPDWFETRAQLTIPAADADVEELVDELIVDLAREAGVPIYSDAA